MSKVRRVTILPVSSVAVQAPVAVSQSLMVVMDDPEGWNTKIDAFRSQM